MIKQTLSDQAIIVEEDGEDRAIVMAPVDYRILVAMLAYHTSPVEERQAQNGAILFIGLPESELCGMTKQERWNRVMRAYLNDEISLGRAANLLDISRFQLDKCFQRLNIPRRIGPADLEDARSEVNVALSTLKEVGPTCLHTVQNITLDEANTLLDEMIEHGYYSPVKSLDEIVYSS